MSNKRASASMRELPVNQFGKGSPESSNGSRVRHSVLRQLVTLETMPMDQLRERGAVCMAASRPATRDSSSSNAWPIGIQELFYGGLSDAAKTRLQQAAQDDPMARMQRRVSGNPRSQVDILPGTRFVRIWKDCRYEVLAHENGFEYEGRMFRSLSAVAREITGTRWNGKIFFGLKKGKRGGQHA